MITRKGFDICIHQDRITKTYPDLSELSLDENPDYGLASRWLTSKHNQQKHFELIQKLHPDYALDITHNSDDATVSIDFKLITGIPAVHIFRGKKVITDLSYYADTFIRDAKDYFYKLQPFVNHDFNLSNALLGLDNHFHFVDTDEIDYATREQAKDLFFNICNDVAVRAFSANRNFQLPDFYYDTSWFGDYKPNGESFYHEQ